MNIYLFNIKSNKLQIINSATSAIEKLYNLNYRIPTITEINNNAQLKHDHAFKLIENIKYMISANTEKIPLYDIITKNMYIKEASKVYDYVVNYNFRFPDEKLLNNLKAEKIKLENMNDKNILLERTLRKYKLIFSFINQLNMDELYKQFIKFMYEYSEVGQDYFTCTKPSFIPYLKYSKPYYTKREIVNLALNMNLIKKTDEYNIDNLCNEVKINDIKAKTLISHQKYINNANKIGLIQYYTIQGSSVINNYLRNSTNYTEKNEYLENKIIKPMWKLLLKSPIFDNDYIVYRYINTNKFLKHLQIGDIWYDEGFLSTTRNPFFIPKDFSFGTILMKIIIPKNTIGVGLLLETFSHFPEEQELLFPPKTKFKLINKDKNIDFFHINKKYSGKIKRRYEFVWQSNEQISFPRQNILNINTINFSTLQQNNTTNEFYYLWHDFTEKYVKNVESQLPIEQINIIINNKPYMCFIEDYNSMGAYKNYYAVKNTKMGRGIYAFYKKYFLFYIEFEEKNNKNVMHVNYYTKFNKLNKNKIINERDFIDFLRNIGKYFRINKIKIYCDYIVCKNIDNIAIGNYNSDYYKYLKHGTKKYYGITDIKPKFNYSDLDALFSIPINKILNKDDQDILFQIYKKIYDGENNIGDFYIWLVDNKCSMIDILVNDNKIKRIYNKQNNIFVKDYYIIYLQNK